MGFIYLLLCFLQVIIGLGLIIVVTMQESKNDGLTGQIGTSATSSFKGKAGREEHLNLLTRNAAIAFFSEMRTVAGGKGINLARVYQTLGGQAVTTGFLGGLNGRMIARGLTQERIADAFVRVRDESRLCIAIVDPKRGTQTEVNEPGPAIPVRAVRALYRRVTDLLSQQRFKFVLLCGSLPPDAPPTLYADLIEIARRAGVPAVLDTSGAALRAGLRAKPWMVKPNRFELESVLGQPVRDRAQMLEAARQLHAQGVAVVAATLGAEGAILVTEAGTWTAVPPAVPFSSAVASGDSFLAAFVWSWTQGERPGDAPSALRLATGAGAANAAVIGAGACTRESIYAQAARAEIRAIASPPAPLS